MPGFAEFSGFDFNKPLSKEELIKAVRFMVAAEYEAVQLYGQIKDAAQDEKIKKAIQSIIDEEKVHAGEFLQMVHYLDPEEKKFYDEGAKETEESLKCAYKMPVADYIRSQVVDSSYVWEKGDYDPKIKTLKYKSPFTGKKFHVSP